MSAGTFPGSLELVCSVTSLSPSTYTRSTSGSATMRQDYKTETSSFLCFLVWNLCLCCPGESNFCHCHLSRPLPLPLHCHLAPTNISPHPLLVPWCGCYFYLTLTGSFHFKLSCQIVLTLHSPGHTPWTTAITLQQPLLPLPPATFHQEYCLLPHQLSTK